MDIETKFYALKFIWIKKLLDNDFHPWKSMADHLYQSLGGVSVFHSNLQLSASCSTELSGLPIFYQELIQLWHKPASQNTILNILNLLEIDCKKVYLIPHKVKIEPLLEYFNIKFRITFFI